MGGHRLLQLVAFMLAGMIGFGLWIFGFIFNVVQRIHAIFVSAAPSSPMQENGSATGAAEQTGLRDVIQEPAPTPPADLP